MQVILTPAYCVDSIKGATISGGAFLIGRGKHCHLQICVPDMSRSHCRIHVGAVPTVRDLESRNGTFVNGHRIRGEHLLNDGDVLGVGSTMLVVQIRTEEPHDAAAVDEEGDASHAPSRPMPHSAYFRKSLQGRQLSDSV
ncbi:MAG: FHA domain-containing protein [Pirellulaceae bacterium]